MTNLNASLIAKAYGAVDAAMAGAAPFMRKRLHRGWRTCLAVENIRDAPSGPYFARALLASRWRCSLLLRYVLQLTRPQLRTFLEDRELTAWLLLDRSPSMDFGPTERPKEAVLIEEEKRVDEHLVGCRIDGQPLEAPRPAR